MFLLAALPSSKAIATADRLPTTPRSAPSPPNVYQCMTERFDTGWLTARFARIAPNETVCAPFSHPQCLNCSAHGERYRARFSTSGGSAPGCAGKRTAQACAVPPRCSVFLRKIIVAIIGVETEYGKNTGRFGVMQALSTLAFGYPTAGGVLPRGSLSSSCCSPGENRFDPLGGQGSYAGASGFPSSCRAANAAMRSTSTATAESISRSASDAIGSVASFPSQHGWESGGPIAVPAHIESDPAALLAPGTPERTLAELKLEGVHADGDPTRPAALIDLATPEQATEYWIGFQNFVITRYNRSAFYAMSAFQLAERSATQGVAIRQAVAGDAAALDDTGWLSASIWI